MNNILPCPSLRRDKQEKACKIAEIHFYTPIPSNRSDSPFAHTHKKNVYHSHHFRLILNSYRICSKHFSLSVISHCHVSLICVLGGDQTGVTLQNSSGRWCGKKLQDSLSPHDRCRWVFKTTLHLIIPSFEVMRSWMVFSLQISFMQISYFLNRGRNPRDSFWQMISIVTERITGFNC